MNVNKLKIDEISKTNLSKINRVCRYYRNRKHKEPLKMLIKELIDEELTLPIKDIIKFINSNLNTPSDSLENLTYIYDDKKIVLMSVREAIDSLISYAALIKKREEELIQKKKEEEVLFVRNKIKTFLLTSNNGIRENWIKSDEDISSEIKIDFNFQTEIDNVKREIVK